MTAYRADIIAVATAHGLEADLVQALVEQESAYDPWAWNPEPRYHYFWNVQTRAPFRAVTATETAAKFPPHDFPTLAGDNDQEWWGQQASWGLMQILGAVAREHGYDAPYLTTLTDPAVNLGLGCAHLAGLVAWARGKYTGLASAADAKIRVSALAAYNGGKAQNAPDEIALRNRDYALRVLARYERIRKGGGGLRLA